MVFSLSTGGGQGLPAANQYINWYPVPLPNGKTDKIPCDMHGRTFNHTSPANWRSLSDVCRSTHRPGFVFSANDDYVFVDVDNAYSMATGVWSPMAIDALNTFPDAFTEVSQSGIGLHLIFCGARALPRDHGNRVKDLEVYTEGRFVALTGYMAKGSAEVDYSDRIAAFMQRYNIPLERPKMRLDEGRDPAWIGPEDDNELIALALTQTPTLRQQAGKKPTFRQLWEFDIPALARIWPVEGRDDGMPFMRSEVDLSLMTNLSYFTGRDMPRMIRLFEQWRGYRPEQYEGKKAYKLERIVTRACGNPYVLQRGPSEHALQATITPPPPGGARPLCNNLLGLFNGAIIADTDYPDLQWLVDEMIPEGCQLLIGKPKKGKSWMSLQLAVAVATGTEFMGQEVKKGRVLYLALEDTKRRIKKRLRATCQAVGVNYREAGGQILFGTSEDNIPTADKGLYDMIAQALDADSGITLVIIDTLHKARPAPIKGEGIYAYDRRCVDPLTEILNNRPGRSMLIVHHATKNVPEDPYDMASGSMGLTGACDGGLFLAVNGAGQTVLYVNCRDGEGPMELAVKLSDAHWENMGDADIAGLSDVRVKIIAAMQKYSFAIGPKEIADEIGESAVNVRKRLRAMAASNQVIKEAYGKYKLTPAALNLGIAPPS